MARVSTLRLRIRVLVLVTLASLTRAAEGPITDISCTFTPVILEFGGADDASCEELLCQTADNRDHSIVVPGYYPKCSTDTPTPVINTRSIASPELQIAKGFESLVPGDVIKLTGRSGSAANERTAGSTADPSTSIVEASSPPEVVQRAPQVASRAVATERRNFLMLRLVYDDGAASGCDRDCAWNGLFSQTAESSNGVMGSLKKSWSEMSYGSMIIDKATSMHFDVRIPGNMPTSGCSYRTQGGKADEWMQQNHPDIDIASFSHIEYYLPDTFKCDWWGIASVGCRPPKHIFEPREGTRCWSYLRADPSGLPQSLRLHELGHNLGLRHAGRGANAYGDSSAVMGMPYPSWRGYLATNRHQMGYIPDTHVYTAADQKTVVLTLNSVSGSSSAADPSSATYMGARWFCPECTGRQWRGGGYIFVSYRSHEHLDRDLTGEMADAVFVHVQGPWTHAGWGTGSILYKVLQGSAGLTKEDRRYTITREGNSQVFVCFTDHNVAGRDTARVVIDRTGTKSLGMLQSACDSGVMQPMPPAKPAAASAGPLLRSVQLQ